MSEVGPVVRVPTGRDDVAVSFVAPTRPFDDFVVDFEVHIEGPGLTAKGWTRTIAGDEMTEFFNKMDADFRGWQGERTWRSLEGNLTMEARHLGRHVRLVVSLADDYRSDAWTVVVPAAVLPGEELRQLAADVQTFFRTALSAAE